jgi:hypothetical protein
MLRVSASYLRDKLFFKGIPLCRLIPPPPKHILISHLPNSHVGDEIIFNARLVLRQGLSLADFLFGKSAKSKQMI